MAFWALEETIYLRIHPSFHPSIPSFPFVVVRLGADLPRVAPTSGHAAFISTEVSREFRKMTDPVTESNHTVLRRGKRFQFSPFSCCARL